MRRFHLGLLFAYFVLAAFVLLISCYLTQEMLYVVPFVAKVIESSAKSKVFKPPNPWVMAIMSVLVELHQMPDLKVGLRLLK